MNYYPGAGLTVGTAILGSMVGQAMPAGTPYILCKIWGKILTPEGDPMGSLGSRLSGDSGSVVLVPFWDGVLVYAAIAAIAESGGAVISKSKIKTTTNEYGYFEFSVIQGLTVTVTSPLAGVSVPVDTTALTSINLSTLY